MRTQKSMIASIFALNLVVAALFMPAGVSWAQSDDHMIEKQTLAKTTDAKSE